MKGARLKFSDKPRWGYKQHLFEHRFVSRMEAELLVKLEEESAAPVSAPPPPPRVIPWTTELWMQQMQAYMSSGPKRARGNGEQIA